VNGAGNPEQAADSACSPESLEVGPGKNQPGYFVGQPENVEVDDQSERDVKQFHVAEQLRFMNRMNGFDCLDFNKQALVDEQVKPERLFPLELFVSNDNPIQS
jgi:hypothetical protein